MILALALSALLAHSTAFANGQSLYYLHCASCHGMRMNGSVNGPPLRNVSAAMVHFMVDTGRMPAQVPWVEQVHKTPQFSPSQLNALVTYVVTTDGTNDTKLPVVSSGDAGRGKILFEQNCEHCHGAAGEGGAIAGKYENVAPNLMQATPIQVAEVIRAGPGEMPRFNSHVLSDTDVNDIASYVRLLQKQRFGPGGLALANVGPVPEGLVAWVFGLGLLMLLIRRLGTH